MEPRIPAVGVKSPTIISEEGGNLRLVLANNTAVDVIVVNPRMISADSQGQGKELKN